MRTTLLFLLCAMHLSLSAQLRTRVALTAPNAVELGLEYIQRSDALHLSYGASVLNGQRDWTATGYVNVGYGGTKADGWGTTPLIGTRLGYQVHPTRDLPDAFVLAPYVAVRGRKRTYEVFLRVAWHNGFTHLLAQNAAQFGGGVAVVF